MKYDVAILGATGAVGQRYIELLEDHPWFDVGVLTASERSAKNRYGEVCDWKLSSEMPEKVKNLEVVSTSLKDVKRTDQVDLAFSALPGDVAGPVEDEFAENIPVVSKASAHRMDADVPLIIPEVNPEHLELIEVQKENKERNGFISTDPNCSTIQLTISLKPLMELGLSEVALTTLQALSGAGYPGVASLDIVDNVIPYISGEEHKLESEPLKILGDFEGDHIEESDIDISASCNRVDLKDGHLESVWVDLEDEKSVDRVLETFETFEGPQKISRLPSAPERPLEVMDEKDRPQPRLDRNTNEGMSVCVGRVRDDPIFSIKYSCLGHNTIRGAAGSGILHAELLEKEDYI
ncbi:MAG: aspartate-semialdehyde dehydrogenase [Candidatus Thermoplasmatota archaeon]|nr:aspartate-semialdehyde dehydrogenase [Candidatus Thermoplasmatota archaeon]